MSSRRVWVQVPRALFAAASLVATVSLSAGEPTFYQNVQPILQKSCVGCHGGDSPKGKLSLESLESLQVGGKKGPPVVPGKAEESLLYLLASRKKKPAMPPKAEDSLAAADIDVIRAWIDAGAPPGEPKVEAAPYSRPLLPPIYQRPPLISALAYSTDGRRLFVAGYREILVVDAEPDSPQGASPRARLVGEAERLNALGSSSGRPMAGRRRRLARAFRGAASLEPRNRGPRALSSPGQGHVVRGGVLAGRFPDRCGGDRSDRTRARGGHAESGLLG
jgi:mono/diheme cytochrome c family protein